MDRESRILKTRFTFTFTFTFRAFQGSWTLLEIYILGVLKKGRWSSIWVNTVVRNLSECADHLFMPSSMSTRPNERRKRRAGEEEEERL